MAPDAPPLHLVRQRRCATCRSTTATRSATADVVVDGRVRGRHAGPGVPRPRVRARHPRRARAASTSTSPPSGCTSTATRSPRASACRRRRCGCTLGGVGGAFGGREDLSMQIHACMLALHTRPAGEDRLQPRGVVLRPRPPPPVPDALRARRDPRRPTSSTCGRAIVLDGGAYASSSTAVVRERRQLRRRALRRAQRAHRRLRHLHQQPAVRRHARLRRGAGRRSRHEAQMDKLAAALGIDPVELRIRNAMEPGSQHADRPGGRRPGAGRASCWSALRAMPLPPAAAQARRRPARAARRRLEHHPRRGRRARRRLRGRLQERRLLRGLRRLLDRARAAVARRRRAAGRGPHRGGRGRPGRRSPCRRRSPAPSSASSAWRARRRHAGRLGRVELGVAPDLRHRRRGQGRLRGGARALRGAAASAA